VHHRVVHLVEADAGFQQVAIGRAGGTDRGLHVAERRHDDPDIDAGAGDPVEFLALLVRRDEVAAPQPDPAAGVIHHRQQRGVVQRLLLARGTADDPDGLHAHPRQGGNGWHGSISTMHGAFRLLLPGQLHQTRIASESESG